MLACVKFAHVDRCYAEKGISEEEDRGSSSVPSSTKCCERVGTVELEHANLVCLCA